jgi:hypothetical protein
MFPPFEDQVSLGWLGVEELKMNKSTLADMMGMTRNTLNMSLRKSQFEQLNKNPRQNLMGVTPTGPFGSHFQCCGNRDFLVAAHPSYLCSAS